MNEVMSEKDLLNEVWKPVVGYEGLYDVSNFGRVRSLNYGGTGRVQMMKLIYDRDGYLKVNLYKNGKGKYCSSHRLVWEAFVGKIPEGMQIDHINGIKDDNRLENLRVTTSKENNNNPITRKRHIEALRKLAKDQVWQKKHIEGIRKYNTKPVVQIDLYTGEVIRKWDCAIDVKTELGIDNSSIIKCCRGKLKHAGYYRWAYFTPPAVVYVPEFMKYFE